jgi:capsid portal protein
MLCDNRSGHFCASCRRTGFWHCPEAGWDTGCRQMKPQQHHPGCSHWAKLQQEEAEAKSQELPCSTPEP